MRKEEGWGIPYEQETSKSIVTVKLELIYFLLFSDIQLIIKSSVSKTDVLFYGSSSPSIYIVPLQNFILYQWH